MMAKLRSSAPLVKQGVDWWLGEMTRLLTRLTGGRLQRRRDTVIIDIGGNEARFSLQSNGQVSPLGSVAHDARLLPAQIQNSIIGDQPGRRALVLRIASSQGLTKTLTLPFAVEGNLTQVVSFEVARQTPFQPEQVYYDHQISDRDDKAKMVEVRLAVIPKPAVDDKLGLLEKWDLKPTVLELVDDAGATEARIQLQTASAASGEPQDRMRRYRLVTVAAVLSVAVLVVLALVSKTGEQSDLEARIEAVRADAAQAAAMRSEIRQKMGRHSFLYSRKRQVPAMTAILNEITRLLPDNTWLNRVEVRDMEVEIYGNSPQASTLIAILERSSYLSRVRFRSPVTRDERASNDRFHISATVAPGVIR